MGISCRRSHRFLTIHSSVDDVVRHAIINTTPSLYIFRLCLTIMHTAVEMFKLETRTDVGRPLLIRDDHQNLDTFVNSTEFLSILYDSSKLNIGHKYLRLIILGLYLI